MRAELLADLKHIFRALTIFSATHFAFAGQSVVATPETTPPPGQRRSADPPLPPLVQQLQGQLYQHAYCQRFRGHLAPPLPAAPPADNDLTPALSQANASRERWETGWQIAQLLPTGQVVAHRQGRTRTLWPGEFVTPDGPGMAPRVGAPIRVFFPRESTSVQPGFYFAFGEAATESDDPFSIVRFYWNVSAEGVVPLTAALTRPLNRFQVPFRYKCLCYRTHTTRVDTAVLYVKKRYARVVAELLADVHPQVATHLEPDTPLFTRRLAPGFAFAEDPATGESFGMHRCRLLTEAIWQAFLQGQQSEQARLEAVVHQFEQAGLSLEHPYLSAGMVDQYEFPRYAAS